MTKHFLLILLFGGLLFISACGERKDPATYNNKIISVVNNSEQHVTAMNNAVNAADYARAEEVRLAWGKSLDEDLKQVNKLGDFNGDASFQEAVLKGLNGYKKIVTDDYPKLIALRKEANAAHADEEARLLNNINIAFENMASGVNEASYTFERKYNK